MSPYDGVVERWAAVIVAAFLTFRPTDLAKLFVWLRGVGLKKKGEGEAHQAGIPENK